MTKVYFIKYGRKEVREGQRLAGTLFESEMESRATGTAKFWRTTAANSAFHAHVMCCIGPRPDLELEYSAPSPLGWKNRLGASEGVPPQQPSERTRQLAKPGTKRIISLSLSCFLLTPHNSSLIMRATLILLALLSVLSSAYGSGLKYTLDPAKLSLTTVDGSSRFSKDLTTAPESAEPTQLEPDDVIRLSFALKVDGKWSKEHLPHQAVVVLSQNGDAGAVSYPLAVKPASGKVTWNLVCKTQFVGSKLGVTGFD